MIVHCSDGRFDLREGDWTILPKAFDETGMVLAHCLLKDLLKNKVTICDDDDLGDLVKSVVHTITLKGDEYDWYLQYRTIALVLLGENRNFGRVLVLLLLTRGFRKVVQDECLMIWLQEVLKEADCSCYDIPDACLTKVRSRSSWLFLGCQILIMLFLFTRPILF